MYGYLLVGRESRQRVRFPDGTSVVVDAGGAPSVVQDWIERQPPAKPADPDPPPPAAADLTAELAAWQALHDAWSERLSVALVDSHSILHGRMLREHFLADDPEPLRPGDGPEAAERMEAAPPAPAEPEPEVLAESWWVAVFAGASLREPLTAAGAYPYDEVAALLTRLEAEAGWTVVDIDLSRVAYHQHDASRVDIVGASLLLHRSAGRRDG